MSLEELESEGQKVGVLERRQAYGADLSGLQEMAMYGLKGMAAYAEHAFVLGQESDEVFGFCHEALAKLSRKDEQTLEGLLQLCLDVGKMNVEVMRLLDEGATTRYGHPKPTAVRTTAVKGKCALISGHDLRDLEELLKQTEGKGINVYTHGEMLPAHGYPGLKEKYPHLVGTSSPHIRTRRRSWFLTTRVVRCRFLHQVTTAVLGSSRRSSSPLSLVPF
jgi:hydroxylamine reductase